MNNLNQGITGVVGLCKTELIELNGGDYDRPYGEPDYIQPYIGDSGRGSAVAPKGIIGEALRIIWDKIF